LLAAQREAEARERLVEIRIGGIEALAVGVSRIAGSETARFSISSLSRER
jgi:hypothetical protein